MELDWFIASLQNRRIYLTESDYNRFPAINEPEHVKLGNHGLFNIQLFALQLIDINTVNVFVNKYLQAIVV